MILPPQFLLRLAFTCPYVRGIPRQKGQSLLELGDKCRIQSLALAEGKAPFADVRLAWNELGIGAQVEVRGKQDSGVGSADRPRASDGLTLWVDTRDARTSHRASRFCHQFHFLVSGGGPDHDEPQFLQSKINRALHDAPLAQSSAVQFHMRHTPAGYVVEAFLPAAVLHGFDPEQNRRLGFYYVVRDSELGEQFLSVGADFPYWEDPSLWHVLELVR